jgi:hypothetical protein
MGFSLILICRYCDAASALALALAKSAAALPLTKVDG